jgi:hypothetical protein
VALQLHANEGAQVQAQLGRVHFRAVARDHPVRLEPLHPAQAGGRREVHAFGQLDVAQTPFCQQGAQQVRARLPEVIDVFILPPSRAELERRLRGRATDAEDVVQRRLNDAAADMAHWSEFDYVVVNDDFGQAVEDLRAIVAGRGEASRSSAPGFASLATRLTGDHAVRE